MTGAPRAIGDGKPAGQTPRLTGHSSGVTCRGVDPAIVSYSRVRLPPLIRLSPAATRRTKNTTARTVTQSNVPHPAVFTSVLASVGCGVGCAAENALSSMRGGDA